MLNSKKIKVILWFLYCAILLVKTLAQKTEIIDCSNEELVTSVFNDPIDLTLRGVIKVYENVTISEILTTTNNEFEHNYIDARLETSPTNETTNLILFTTQQFENYAKEQTAARISLKINLGCGMGKERVVIFFQPLKEGNYFSPIFSQLSYELIMPTPIFAGFDLTAFLEITAKDNDLTHNQIVFTSNDSSKHHISVGTQNVTSLDKKTYFANLTLEKIFLELPQPIEFEIVATDNGDPPKSSKASVIIRSDNNRSLPVKPKFAQALYKGLIDIDFNMATLRTQLASGTYSPEVTFSLKGLNTSCFDLRDNKNGTVDIIWNPVNLNSSELLKLKKWELELNAEHKSLAEIGRASIIVEMADFKSYFHFMSSYCEGNIDELGELHITPIIFNPSLYKPDVEFRLFENFYDFFNLSIQSFSIQLQLNNNFTWQSVDDISYLKLTLLATWENLSSMTNIVIKLPQTKEHTPPQMFQFEKPLYVGHLNQTDDLELETIQLQTDVNNTHEIQYSLSGNGSNEFYIETSEKRINVKANLSSSGKENELNSLYLLVLEAKNSVRKTFASLVIDRTQHNNAAIKNIFLTSFIMGKILVNNATQNLSLDSIRLSIQMVDSFQDIKFRLRGDHSLHFEIRENITSHSVDLVLKTSLSSKILNSKNFLNLSLQAILSGPRAFNETLKILIELPIKDCPSQIITLPDDPPQFSSSKYVFTAYTNQTGILGVVNAFSKKRNATFHYILRVQNNMLAQRLSINPFTGELTLYAVIEEGRYIFNITAENIETRERAFVRALLKVQPKEECKLFEGVAVEKTLMIRHLDEEKPYHGLIDMKVNENCTFHIVDMLPNDKEYVYINPIFHMLDVIAIDREDMIFENMSDSQIVVKLRLKCNKEGVPPSLNIEIPKHVESRKPENIFAEDIAYAPDIMWLHIKIDDINDNAPQFKLPEGPQYLGYPVGNVALDIYPEYLTTIEAFDRDLGLNAKINFSMRDNAYFNIDRETGKIYPKGKVLSKDQQTELIISATDQNGEGLTSATVIIVKALAPDFYSLVTLKENSLKTKRDIEKELSLETGYNINVIKISYIPEIKETRSFKNTSLNCKAWIYAYQRQQLVQSRELQKQFFNKNPDNSIVNIESYEEVLALHSAQKINSNLAYIVSTILLSLISTSFLIFIVWRFCYEPTLNSKCDTKSSTLAVNNNNANGQQISAECSHGSVSAEDCIECNNHEDHHVKFNDLAVDNVIVDEAQSK